MVWDWQVLRAEPIPFWPNLFFFSYSYYFLFFFFQWIGCVGLGLQIDRVL